MQEKAFRVLLVTALAMALAPFATAQQKFNVTPGYNYQYSDQGGGRHIHTNGWFTSAAFDVTSNVSITLEADNYYARGTNQHNYVAGPQFTFGSDQQKVRPLVYVQAGDQRSSSGSVTHAFNLQIGGGFNTKLSDKVSLYLAPVEYSLATPSGGALHSYSAKAGLQFTLWQKQ